MRTIAWHEMSWLNEPPTVEVEGDDLVLGTGRDTDFWHRTAYGFIHHDGHLLGTPVPADAAIEVTFVADFKAQFDQAGLMLWASPDTWLKAGVELSDGEFYASVVATAGRSDWSVAPLPEGAAGGAALTFRASRKGDAVTVRYRLAEEQRWRLLRVAYFPPDIEVVAGPMACSPSREGLSVRFRPVLVGPPDAQLHEA